MWEATQLKGRWWWKLNVKYKGTKEPHTNTDTVESVQHLLDILYEQNYFNGWGIQRPQVVKRINAASKIMVTLTGSFY